MQAEILFWVIATCFLIIAGGIAIAVAAGIIPAWFLFIALGFGVGCMFFAVAIDMLECKGNERK